MIRTAQRALLLLLAAFALPAAAAAEEQALNLAYSTSLFVDVHYSDVRATTKVLIDKIVERSPDFCGGEVQLYNGPDHWRTAAESNALTLCIMTTIDYLALEQDGCLEPLFVYEDSGGIGEELLLLTHRESTIQSAEQLSSQTVIIPKSRFSTIARKWLKSLDIEPGKTEEQQKAGKAILSAFFNHRIACVVTRGAFDAMKELNPQIGQQMKILAHSPVYIADIICLSRRSAPEVRRFILETFPDLEYSEDTNQILVAYGIERFAPFYPQQLDALRILLDQPAAAAHETASPPQKETP